jgi:hypothetical protein
MAMILPATIAALNESQRRRPQGVDSDLGSWFPRQPALWKIPKVEQ